MAGISENGILCQEEFQEYKARSVHAKFMNQIFLGIGGATVFGIVAKVTELLIPHALAFTAGTILPLLAITGVAVAGIACLYIGAKYVAKSVMLDQDFQAKKIAHAARGMAPTIPEQMPEQSVPLGNGMQLDEAEQAPDRKWAEKFSKVEAAQDWAAKTQASAASEATMAKGA